MKVITIDAETKKRVYSKKDVAEMCGVSTQTIRLWEKGGKIPQSTRDENDYRYWYEDNIPLILAYANKSVKERHRESRT